MVVLFPNETGHHLDGFSIPAVVSSTQSYVRLLNQVDMKRNKQPEVSANQSITRQISSISFNIERGLPSEGNGEPITERIREEPPVNKQRNSVVETLELSPLPLGLVEEDDYFAKSILPVRPRNEGQRTSLPPVERRERRSGTVQEFKEISPGSVSHHRVNIRPLSSTTVGAGVAADLTEYSSTTELIPLSIAALKDEKSRKLLWLDNASLMAMSLTLSNIWRLPTFLYFNYSGEALIAYVILMTIVGLPLYVLELSLGQFGQTGIINLWRAVPLLKGIGIAQMIAGLYQAFYFPTLMAWAFQYGILGIGGWNSCGSSSQQNLTACLCQEPGSDCKLYGVISEEEACFESHVLHKFGENMNYKMLPMLAVAMIIITLSVSFGNKVMKIILSISGVLSAIILSAALALALTHPNNSLPDSNNTAQHGINLLTPTKSQGFGRGEVWYGAMVQVIFSLALGFGTLPSQSSSSYFSRNVIRDGVVSWMVNILFAIISAITVFAWIGISGLNQTSVVKSNAFIYFVYYNVSSSLWAGLSFALLFLAGMNSMLPLFHGILQNLGDSYPSLKKRFRILTPCLLCAVLLLVNVPGLIPAGNEVVMMWDHYAAGATVLSCLIVHMIGWLWAYGGKSLKRDIECMILRPISFLWNVFWSYVTIILLTTAELWGFFGVPLDGTVDCRYPIWVVAAGWSFYLLALVVAVIFIIKTVVVQAEYGLVKKLTTSIKPDRNWGPQDPLFHSHWKRIIDQQSGIFPYSRGNTITRWLKEEEPDEVTSPISNQDTITNKIQQRASITLVSLPRQRLHDDNGIVTEQ